jgi:hypothetical protein
MESTLFVKNLLLKVYFFLKIAPFIKNYYFL